VGEKNAVGGEAPSMGAMQSATVTEVMGAFAILVPAIIIILALSTASWIEPVLLLISIGVAIMLNMGTNVIYGEVSFISNSVSPILQLAVSIDYAIFLLHAFGDYRKQYADPNVAMRHAIKTSFSTVASSGATTLFGFLALCFMEFMIGADLGINLAKGIIFSFLSATVFLPALTLGMYKLIDRSQHRPLTPSFAGIGKGLRKVSLPITIAVAVLVVPAFLGQSQTSFLYGTEGAGASTRAGTDLKRIEDEFGKSNIAVVLVPKGNLAAERQLAVDLKGLDHVTGVMSYAETVGTQIPQEFLPESVSDQFFSADYSRIIAYTDTNSEGDVAFAVIEDMRNTTSKYYGDDAYTLGRSANLYDMREVVRNDNTVVNLIAIIAIFCVLLVTFRSLVLPLLLLLTIESAIWINLSIPYFTGTNINYIGYLVLNTVQLGATVDYAILLTNTYLRMRKDRPKARAIRDALGSSFKSMLVSATTLSLAGFTLFATSTNPLVCDIGSMLGRGTLLSFGLVVCFLPMLLSIFDPAIERLTLKTRFYHEKEAGEKRRLPAE
jgi:predicted RND superfamily exporter protein